MVGGASLTQIVVAASKVILDEISYKKGEYKN